jgi:hypothetical protein
MYSPSKIMLRAGTVMGFLIVRATLWLRAIMSFFCGFKSTHAGARKPFSRYEF